MNIGVHIENNYYKNILDALKYVKNQTKIFCDCRFSS